MGNETADVRNPTVVMEHKMHHKRFRVPSAGIKV